MGGGRRARRVLAVVGVFVVMAMVGMAVANGAPPVDASVAEFSPPSDDYDLAFEDEFDVIDPDDWSFREGERLGGFNEEDNVEASGGNLHIAFLEEDADGDSDPDYTGGGLISRHDFGYGYYEARVKLYGATKGLHQSFWSMGVRNDAEAAAGRDAANEQVLEIDGFEADSIDADHVDTTAHAYVPHHEGLPPRSYAIGDDGDGGWFTMGYEWLPGQIKWYLDGRHVRTVEFDELYAPQKVWITALPTPEGFGGAVDPLPGAEMLVDYFRYYARQNAGNLLANPGFEYDYDEEGPPVDDLENPISWIETGTTGAGDVVPGGSSGTKALRHESGTVAAKQELEYIRNSTYTLSAQVRTSSPLTGTHTLSVSGHGGSTMTQAISAGGSWHAVTIPNVVVTSGKATVAVNTASTGGQWIEVDDVQFVDTLAWPTVEPEQIVVDNSSGGPAPCTGAPPYCEDGSWLDSGLVGYDNSSTRYASALGNKATWRPSVPEAGLYDVYIYKVVHPVSDSTADIDVVYDGGSASHVLDYTTGESGWVYLGRYPFAAGTTGTITNTRSSGGTHVRADAIKLVRPALVDDFEDGTSAGWRTAGGSWSVAADGGNDFLQQTSTGPDSFASTGDPQWRDATITARVMPTSGTGYSGLVGRYQDTNNFYTCRLNRPAGRLELYKKVAGTWTSLAWDSFAAPEDVWQTLTLDLTGDDISCSVAGGPTVTEMDDASFTTGLAGARVYQEAARIDDVTVWLDVPTP